MVVLGFCEAARDPSLLFANSAPKPRQDVWFEGEAVRLVKEAWQSGYKGLAMLLAVAWDSQLSPVDARNLRVGDMRRDAIGIWFDVARAKTGRQAIATLSPRTARLLQGYRASLPAEPMGAVRVFCNRSGAPYSKDTLGNDFRAVRAKVFGDDESCRMADFHRSGAIETLAGNVSPEKLSKKMANTLSASNRLHHTYAPVQLASVRDADDARKLGRAKLRETKTQRKYPAAGPKVSAEGGGGGGAK
jgi:integrase